MNLAIFLATWEHRTYITAVMLKINPFDQFGVNAGKIYTKSIFLIKINIRDIFSICLLI